MDLETVKDVIQWSAGISAAAVLVYMSILSLQVEYVLKWPVIVAMLSLIILLLYGASALEGIVDSWKGGGGST